jgi:N-acetylglucosamine kinase-like BadF-type ATPase
MVLIAPSTRGTSPGYFLGIDGGGTRTTAWITDREGNVVARTEAGPSNPHKVGLSTAQRELRRATQQALKSLKSVSGRPPSPVLEAVCAGISGSDRPSLHDPLLRWMRRHIPARHHLLTSDAAIALAAALGDSPGIIVIAGTGSIAFARDNRGRLLRVGGWGGQFDDLGSGFDLGRKAVTAALQAFDRRGPRTRLLYRICRALDLADITAVVSRHLEPRQIAALCPLVTEAAQRGDLVARHLCEAAARDLAELPLALLKRAGWVRRGVTVVCMGGVLASSPLILRALARQLHRFAPLARIGMLQGQPVEGALWLARRKAVGGKRKAKGRGSSPAPLACW